MIYTVTLNPALDKEYHVPKLIFDEVLRMERMQIDFGGKGFNVSRMLKALGSNSMALGFVGGHTGKVIAEGLTSLDIEVGLSPIAGETRTNISIVDSAEKHHIKINETGPHVSDSEVESFLRKITSLVKKDDFWVMAGSIPNNVPDDIYAKIINQVNQAGAHAVLDTVGDPLRLGIEKKPYFIKPNIHELSRLVDQDLQDTRKIMRVVSEIHVRGVQIILVSLGAQGALLSDSERFWRGSPPKIDSQNPIGAGDAMVAGMVWRLSEGDSPQQALPWSIACGTAAANLPGTAMPSYAEVKKFKEEVTIEEI